MPRTLSITHHMQTHSPQYPVSSYCSGFTPDSHISAMLSKHKTDPYSPLFSTIALCLFLFSLHSSKSYVSSSFFTVGVNTHNIDSIYNTISQPTHIAHTCTDANQKPPEHTVVFEHRNGERILVSQCLYTSKEKRVIGKMAWLVKHLS